MPDRLHSFTTRQPFIQNLEEYRQLLASVAHIDHHDLCGEERERIEALANLSVLKYSHFASQEILSALEQFQNDLDTLLSFDFISPVAFIRSAESEMDRLNARRTLDEAIRMVNLYNLVTQKKEHLASLKRDWVDLTQRLINTAHQVKSNLIKIVATCESSLSIISNTSVRMKKETVLIEKLKTLFKAQLKDALHNGQQISREDLENSKKIVGLLSDRITLVIGEDLDALAVLYRSIFDHTQKIIKMIDFRIMKIGTRKDGSVKENKDLFVDLWSTLSSLLSCDHLTLNLPEVKADPEKIVLKSREAMLTWYLDLLHDLYVSGAERRAVYDRRKNTSQKFDGLERRSKRDRRSREARVDLLSIPA